MLEGIVRATVVPGKETGKTKYEMYYKFEETVPKIPSHRILAIRRGTRENVLSYTIDTDSEKFIDTMLPTVIRDSASQFAPFLERAVRDGYERLMLPSIRNEARTALRERAEEEAIKVFEDNLRTLLLSPPAGPIGVIGIDPGIRTGCKVAVVDASGKFAENQVLQLSDPSKDLEGAEKILTELVQKHDVRAITIGNGTFSREAEAFARTCGSKERPRLFCRRRERSWCVGVFRIQASARGISRTGRDCPWCDLDCAAPAGSSRGACKDRTAIDRRRAVPARRGSEKVEEEPRRGRWLVREPCWRGSEYRVRGFAEVHLGNQCEAGTQHYCAKRSSLAGFAPGAELKEIEGFGDKTFEQAAGFLRIKDGDNPLDRTAVHPESYPIVEKIAASLRVSLEELIGNADRVNSADFRALEADAGRFTLSDIREELLRPGRDPRDKFVAPKFRDDVKEVVDLQEGMELEGRVSNVTNFGAFVDLGVHQDGLVHISELSHKYIQDAREAVKVGDIVKVKVIGVDQTMKRISLSMKALLPKPPRPPRRKKAAPQQRPAAAAASQGAAAAAPAQPPSRAEAPHARSSSREVRPSNGSAP